MTEWSEKEKAIFSLEGKSNDEFLEKYQPQFVDRGSEHLVYEIPGHKNVVVKVLGKSIEASVVWQMKNSANVDSYAADDEVKSMLDARIKVATEAYREVKKYFKDHVLAERFVKFKAPVNPAFIDLLVRQEYGRALTAVEISSIPASVFVLALVQEKSQALASEDYGSMFRGGYLVKEEDFATRVPAFLFPDIKIGDDDTSLDETDKNSSHSDVYRDFLSTAIKYSNDTKRILDIAGTDNVIMEHTKDGGLTYTLIDAVYPLYTERTLDSLHEYVSKYVETDVVYSEKDMKAIDSLVGNTVDYIYKINKLAAWYGLDSNINLFPNYNKDQQQKALDLILRTIDLWNYKRQ